VREQQLPDLDDEFAQTASEFDTVEELRNDLRERLVRARRIEQASAARDAVLERVLEMVEVPLPEQLVLDEATARHREIEEQLSYAGMTMGQYLESEGQEEADLVEDLDLRVRDSLKAQFVLEEVARVRQVSVSESDLAQHIVRRAQQAGVRPEEYAQEAAKQSQVPALVSEVARAKALALLVESAHVTDASGQTVELKRLQPDGTYADEEADAAPESDEPVS
jgi:trigger factor